MTRNSSHVALPASASWQAGDMNTSSEKPIPTGRGRWLGPLYLGLGVLWLVLAFTSSGGRIPELIAGLLSLLAGCIWLYRTRRESITRQHGSSEVR